MDPEFRDLIELWGREWGLPELALAVSVRYNARLQKSLGRCRPTTGRVTLHPALKDALPERRAEVLCHEVAHIAAFQLHGTAALPHGPEWRALVSRAGFTPRVRSSETVKKGRRLSEPSAILPYEHRCPVCQSVRFARRPVSRWRCGECLEAGLGGELVITRHPGSSPGP